MVATHKNLGKMYSLAIYGIYANKLLIFRYANNSNTKEYSFNFHGEICYLEDDPLGFIQGEELLIFHGIVLTTFY